jgi:iron complex outermembrane receptor protein
LRLELDHPQLFNAKLKPERSRQFSLGAVMAHAQHQHQPRLLEHPEEAPDQQHRCRRHPEQPGQVREPGPPLRRKRLCEYDPAASTSATSSCARRIGPPADVGPGPGLSVSDIQTGIGTFAAPQRHLDPEIQAADRQRHALLSNLGQFVNDGVVQRWRHTLSLDWTIGEVPPR